MFYHIITKNMKNILEGPKREIGNHSKDGESIIHCYRYHKDKATFCPIDKAHLINEKKSTCFNHGIG